MLSKEDLTHYRNWVGKSPVEVLRSVVKAGGWHEVFPKHKTFPDWAHSVRNYFNQTPPSLRLRKQKGRPPGSLPCSTVPL